MALSKVQGLPLYKVEQCKPQYKGLLALLVQKGVSDLSPQLLPRLLLAVLTYHSCDSSYVTKLELGKLSIEHQRICLVDSPNLNKEIRRPDEISTENKEQR
jgi:hypothetical protein